MKRFKNILFVADRPGTASPAFERALELTHANRAQLTVMDVVEPMVWSAENQARFGTDLTTILRDRRLDELATMTGPRNDDELMIRVQVATGTPFLEIIKTTLRNRCDLVIKSAERLRDLSYRTLGPNDQHLLRKCPCPVWIDRDERARPYRKILAAVDPVSNLDKDLDRMVLDLAYSFAPWEGSEVHVVHAWRLPGESMLQGGRVRIDELQMQHMLHEQESMHAKALSHLLAHYERDLHDPHVHFIKDSPTPLITRLADELPADLIVIGTVGRTGIPGFFIGNTAESILQSTDLPVLTVKPHDFRSPVTLQ